MDDPGPDPDALQRAIADLAGRLTALEGWSPGQELRALGCLAPGAHGFGCGQEPFPSVFARHGCSILATDLAPDAASAQGWAATNQHSSDLTKLRKADIGEDPAALEHLALRWVDMNDVPHDRDGQFDFCWSACALEHLGSIRAGFDFIRASPRCLRPGGVAVHTTEYNLSSADETLDNWPTVLFQRRHIDGFVAEPRQDGFLVEEPDSSVGNGVLDGFFDIPPWWTEARTLGSPTAHLKLAADGFPATSIGLIIRVPE